MQGGPSHKLAKRSYGPLHVLRHVGLVAYELELPPKAKIHPVFYISLLKPSFGQPTAQVCPFPLPNLGNNMELQPVRILETYRWSVENGEVIEALV